MNWFSNSYDEPGFLYVEASQTFNDVRVVDRDGAESGCSVREVIPESCCPLCLVTRPP
jgi:hypothetical protein